jgi:predicted permease
MDTTTIIIGVIPSIIYLATLSAVNMYIRVAIKNNTQRKRYKKENKINELLTDVFTPIGLFAVIYFASLNIGSKEEYILFVLRIILLIVSIVLSIFQFYFLLKKLKVLKKNTF